MSTAADNPIGNRYVNLDRQLPALLRLRLGQNLIFLRDFSCAGGPFLRSLKMPSPCFMQADDVPYGTKIPGQPEGTYIVALGLVNEAAHGEILIQFSSTERGPCDRTVRLKFSAVQKS